MGHEKPFKKIWCNTRKIGKNGIKKVKLNGLIHSKIVLVKDHIGYKKKKIRSFKSYKTISIGHLLWDMRNHSKICANGHFF
jgi:hypothetical protein